MDELKKYNWTICTYEGVQIIKHEQGSFYIGDIDIEDVKISEYSNGFNLSQEEIDKINKEPDWESLRGKNLDKKLDRW